MQFAPAPIFDLTPQEASTFRKTIGNFTPVRRGVIAAATRDVVTEPYTVMQKLGLDWGTQRPREYTPHVTVGAFNDWVDRQVEKQLEENRQKREAARQDIADRAMEIATDAIKAEEDAKVLQALTQAADNA